MRRKVDIDSESSFEELVRRSFFLGEQALEVYMSRNGVDRETALRHFERERQRGRTPSRVMMGPEEQS